MLRYGAGLTGTAAWTLVSVKWSNCGLLNDPIEATVHWVGRDQVLSIPIILYTTLLLRLLSSQSRIKSWLREFKNLAQSFTMS